MAPINDNFADRILLTGSTFATTGDNTGATLESGEPSYGQYSVWYEWVAPSDMVFSIDTEGSTGMDDTKLGVYTGTSVNALTIIVQDDDSGTGYLSKARFNAVSGTSYKIAVAGYGSSDYGSFNLNGAVYVPPVWTYSYTEIYKSWADHPKCMARDSTGRMWLVLMDTISYDWYFLYYSDDTGATWTHDSQIPSYGGTYQYDGALIIDSSDTLHFVCVERTGSTRPLIYNTKSLGYSWGTPELILTPLSTDELDLTIDSSNKIHLLWIGYATGSTPNVNHVIRDGSWGSNTVISNGYKCVGRISAECDSLDNIHLMYSGLNASSGYQYQVKYGIYHGSWTISDLTSITGNYSYDCGLTVDSDDDIHVLYFNQDTFKYEYREKTSGVWGSVETVADGIYYTELAPFIDSSGKIYVFVDSYDEDVNQTAVIIKDGTWGSVQVISASDLDLYTGFNYCSYVPAAGRNVPATGAFVIAYDYDIESCYFIYSQDFAFISATDFVATAIGMELELLDPQISVPYPAIAMEMGLSLYDGEALPNLYYASALSLSAGTGSPAIFNPQQKFSLSIATLANSNSSASIAINKNTSRTAGLDRTYDRNRGRNRIEWGTTANKPVIFSSGIGAKPISFYARANNNPVIFYLRKSLVTAYEFFKLTISRIESLTMTNWIITAYTIGKDWYQSLLDKIGTSNSNSSIIISENIAMTNPDSSEKLEINYDEDKTDNGAIEPAVSGLSDSVIISQTKNNTETIGTSYTTTVS